MGTNKRYGSDTSESAFNEALLRPEPISLTEEELDFTHHSITEAQTPIPAQAWVRFHEATIHTQCRVIAWTDRAVKVEWTMHSGARRVAWIWSNAAEPI